MVSSVSTATLEKTEYRPGKIAGLVFAAIFLATAAVLVWLGITLTPRDVKAMDGLNRIIFTVVPIWLFAWVFALVFALFAFGFLHRTLRSEPTLSVSAEGVKVYREKLIQWSAIKQIEASESELILTLAPDADACRDESQRRKKWVFRRSGKGRVVLSSLALGALPGDVKSELEIRRMSVNTPEKI
jgi:hypothetical protein